jgi:hypothetical protein
MNREKSNPTLKASNMRAAHLLLAFSERAFA